MRAFVSFAILCSLLLSGCAQETPSGDATINDDAGDAGDGAGGSGGPGVENGGAAADGGNGTIPSVPTAMLGMDVVNGTAPLHVNFTVDATNATAWTLDFGDGNATEGTSFPANVTHVFPVGDHNITLTVSGHGGNATQLATLSVVEATDTVVVPAPFSKTVTMDLPCPGCGDAGTSSCAWRIHGNDAAQDCAWIDFPDDLVGQPFTLKGQGLDADLLFWDSCDDGVNQKFHGSGDESGIIPAGAGCVLVWEQLDFMVDLVFTITPV